MYSTLAPPQAQWVDRTLNGLSLTQAVAQLFNVSRPLEDAAAWLQILDQTPVGCMSVRTKSAATYAQIVREVQQHAPIPLLVVANMEHGAAEWPDHGTDFPMLMAAGAANDEALVAPALHHRGGGGLDEPADRGGDPGALPGQREAAEDRKSVV